MQQQFRVDTLVVVRRVGEMQPDVAQRGGAQQCVAEGVDHHVAVRVGDAPLVVFDPDAAQHEGQPFGQCVYVVSVSDSEKHGHQSSKSLK